MKSFFVYCALILLAVVHVNGREKERPVRVLKPAGSPDATLMNINAISAWYDADGQSERNPDNGNSGLYYPQGTSTVIYASGLMMGAIATDGISTGPRVTGFSYNKGFKSGSIIGTRTGVTEDPASPDVRIWRVRRDYAAADLQRDAAEFLMKDPSLVTASDKGAMAAQYKKDWQEWPASKGAPFYDANHDGIYTPQFKTVDGKEVPVLFPEADEPGLANADQVLYYTCNDIRAGDSPWKSKPMGIEQQVTIWGYASGGAMQNALFKRYRLIYKGTAATPDTARLTNMYICHWSDPDLGDAGDDFVGIDTTLDLGYAYNSKTLDAEYKKYNMVPPSVGYALLQGPTVPSPGDTAVVDLKRKPGYKNLPTTSFLYFAAGGLYSDPPFTLNGSIQWYQMLRGLYPNPQGPPDPEPMIDHITGQPTKFQLSGDPVRNTGWVDGMLDLPGDRRLLLSTGPFTMAVNDTQEVVFAVAGGRGTDHLNSITELKANVRTVQTLYRSLFTTRPPTASVRVDYPVPGEAAIHLRAQGPAGAFTAMTASASGTTVPLFDDGAHDDSLAGDGIFANTVSVARSKSPISVDLSFTPKNGTPVVIEKAVDQLTIAGPVEVTGAVVRFDNVNNDGVVNNSEYVEYSLTITNNTGFVIDNVVVTPPSGDPFFSEVKVGSIGAGVAVTTPALKPFAFRIPVNTGEPVHPVTVFIADGNGNRWNGHWDFPVVQRTILQDTVDLNGINVIGVNDARIKTVVYNKEQSGKVYQIWFGRNYFNGAPEYTVIDPSLVRFSTVLVPRYSYEPGWPEGYGEFVLSPAMDQMQYSVIIQNPVSPVTGVWIGSARYGSALYALSMIKTNVFAGTWQFPESLRTELRSGNLFVYVTTEKGWGGESVGVIGDGLAKRSLMLGSANGLYPPFTGAVETKLTGLSLYVVPPPVAVKTVDQVSPVTATVKGVPDPSGTYRVYDDPPTSWPGNYSPSVVEIRFLPGEQWAMAVPPVPAPVPASAYLVKVPFAVYCDTARVWPVIADSAKDSLWNMTGNSLREGKHAFDAILSIDIDKDNASNSLSYYTAPTPITSAWKARIINGYNGVVKNLVITNEKGDGIAPPAGTVIRIKPYKKINPGDVTSFTVKTLGVFDRSTTAPDRFEISQNYPNPFNPSTTIEFAVPHRAEISMKVYDIVGREVASLAKGSYEPGRYRITWDGRSAMGRPVSSGVYFCRFTSGSFASVKKLLLIK